MKVYPGIILASVLCVFSLCVADAALAQSKNVSVLERPRPEFDAPGIRVSAFVLHPHVKAALKYNDNVFATENNRQGDYIYHVQEGISAASTWSRHSLAAGVFVDHFGHFDLTNEDHTDVSVVSKGTLDVASSTELGAGLAYEYKAEPRSFSSSPVGSDEPIRFHAFHANSHIGHQFNRVGVAARYDYRYLNFNDGEFSNGTEIDQDDRDRQIFNLTGRVEYDYTPDTSVFVEFGGNYRRYRLQPPSVAIDRDSDGIVVLGGAAFDITNLIRGEIGVGYFRQTFDDPSFDDASGFSIRAGAEWFVTGLTTVNAAASRTVEDSGIVGSAAFVSTNLTAGIDHELMRNFIVSASARYRNDDFEGVDRTDDIFATRIAGRYLMNRYTTLETFYNFEHQSSSGAASGRDFDVNIIGVSIKLAR